MQPIDLKEYRLYDVGLFMFCKSIKGDHQYILLCKDKECAIYYMEDTRNNFVQQTFLTSRNQNARVKIYDKPSYGTDNLLDVVYEKPEAIEFQEKAIDYLLNYYDKSNPKKFKTACELRNLKETVLSEDKILNINSDEKIKELELKYKNRSPQVKEIISKRIERGTISSKIKEKYDYCKVCEALGEENSYSFKKRNGEYYIETHHIMPVANLEQGSLGISNLITVCANHHRQFHYGNVEIKENTDEQLAINIDGNKVPAIQKIKVEDV